MSLYQLGDHTLSSGRTSKFKIECDAATDDDVTCWAWMIRQIVGPFSSVEGVPHGGLRLAKELVKHRTIMKWFAPHVPLPHLLVDDVFTSGRSMEVWLENTKTRMNASPKCKVQGIPKIIGAVVYARGPLPDWIRAVHQLPKELWDK